MSYLAGEAMLLCLFWIKMKPCMNGFGGQLTQMLECPVIGAQLDLLQKMESGYESYQGPDVTYEQAQLP